MNLNDCEIVRQYSSSTSGIRPERRLASIELHLREKNKEQGGYCLSFYNEKHDQVSEMKMLFQKAWHWKRLVMNLTAQN